MELIYVWINEYRCIHRQGFCLSPGFDMEMEDSGGGHYRLKIRENGKTSIFRDGPVTNLTVLVGENGSGKTTFLEYVQDLTCFCETIYEKEDKGYRDLARQQVGESKNVIVLREGNVLWVYTNLPEETIEIDGKLTACQVRTVNLCRDGEKARSMLLNAGGFYGITSLYMTNSGYHLLGGSSSYGELKNLVFSPVSLGAASDHFFGSICPENIWLQENGRTRDLFRFYSSFLKKHKGDGEFQQLCDVLFYHRLLETGAFREYVGFVQTDLIIQVKSVFQVFPETWQSVQESDKGMGEGVYEAIRERFGMLHQVYNPTLAKQSLSYIMKADFIAEYSLVHEEILEGVKQEALRGKEIKPGPGHESGAEWIEKVFDELESRFDSRGRNHKGGDAFHGDSRRENTCCEDTYYEDAYFEVADFCELIKELEPCRNLVPVEDMSYKRGVHVTLGQQGEDEWRKNIQPENLQKSSYAQICRFLAEKLRENSRVLRGETGYGSFVLRYISIGNLLFSSGERAFQNLMSWMALGAELSETACIGEHVPQKNILLCMDEIDLYCHPAWQRDFIDNMLRIMRQAYREYHIQVILTTHSPLCLSDVPRENIIYLKNEGGKSVVDKGEHRQTFACNLYELLDDAFYLGHQTMGLFAKDYVDRLIRDIDTMESSKESVFREMQTRIERIGDSFLRRKLEQQLDRKWHRMASVRQQIRQLEEDKERLERRIEELKRQEVPE